MREANWKDRILLLLGRRRAMRVAGDSMRPTLAPDEVVVVSPPRHLSVGDIVVADHPFKQSVTIIKRIAKIEGDRLRLIGDDSAESTDSRTFGNLPRNQIRGKVVSRIKRTPRPDR